MKEGNLDNRDFHILQEGRILNKRYVILDILGEGGFGITYKGHDQFLDITVAIKEFYPHGIVTRNNTVSDNITVTNSSMGDAFDRGRERFLNEAMIIAKFKAQDGIVNFKDFFEENNTVYIVMEYLQGITLRDYLKDNGPMNPADVLEIFIPLFETLDEVHKKGMIHRDISPDNIMLMQNGKVKLMDFGAARDYSEFGEKSLSIMLKPGYAPEEQYRSRGVQGPWTDIYALSATMYKCITGVTPEDSIQRLVDDDVKKPSELGVVILPSIENTIMKGLSVSAKDRYQNLKDFCDDLYAVEEEEAPAEEPILAPEPAIEQEPVIEQEPAAAQEPVKKEEPVKMQKSPGKSSKKKFIPVVILLALLLLAGGAYYGYKSYQKSLEREVPSLASMTVDEASQLAAGEDGESLKVVVSGEEYNNDVEKGKIISQSVDAGTILEKGDTISVIVSKGGLSTVPALTGKKGDEAKQLTESAGLVYQVSDSVYSDDVKKDAVISQDNAEGSTLEEGSTVSVVLSKGIEQVKVPDVTGKELDTAKSKLKKAKIDYDKEHSELVYSDSVDNGHVISQSLDPGKKVDKHTKITLSISKGPKPAPVVKKSSGSSRKKRSSGRKRSSGKKKRSSGRKGWKHIN